MINGLLILGDGVPPAALIADSKKVNKHSFTLAHGQFITINSSYTLE